MGCKFKEASEAVKAGQIVKAKVLSADPKIKHSELSIKALEAPSTPQVKGQPQQRPQQKPQQAQPSMADKLAALSSKFRTR